MTVFSKQWLLAVRKDDFWGVNFVIRDIRIIFVGKKRLGIEDFVVAMPMPKSRIGVLHGSMSAYPSTPFLSIILFIYTH